MIDINEERKQFCLAIAHGNGSLARSILEKYPSQEDFLFKLDESKCNPFLISLWIAAQKTPQYALDVLLKIYQQQAPLSDPFTVAGLKDEVQKLIRELIFPPLKNSLFQALKEIAPHSVSLTVGQDNFLFIIIGYEALDVILHDAFFDDIKQVHRDFAQRIHDRLETVIDEAKLQAKQIIRFDQEERLPSSIKHLLIAKENEKKPSPLANFENITCIGSTPAAPSSSFDVEDLFSKQPRAFITSAVGKRAPFITSVARCRDEERMCSGEEAWRGKRIH